MPWTDQLVDDYGQRGCNIPLQAYRLELKDDVYIKIGRASRRNRNKVSTEHALAETDENCIET